MAGPYRGGCACGAARYEFAAEPMAMNDCQCRQCQKDSGTGHASFLTFVGVTPAVSGEIRCFEVTGDGGTVKSRVFCPTCGTHLYIAFPKMPDVFAVRAGTLDEPARYTPQFVIWTAAAQPWDHIDPAVTRFDRMPPRA
jgi:hypothetical protein